MANFFVGQEVDNHSNISVHVLYKLFTNVRGRRAHARNSQNDLVYVLLGMMMMMIVVRVKKVFDEIASVEDNEALLLEM
ncbi:unnamed protein product [Malus baccata var. baccata]